MGWDWPFAPYWFGLVVILFLSVLFFHGNAILKATLPRFAWRLIFLRFLVGTLFLLLLARPFVTTDEPNPKEFKLVTLTDLSGSMNTKDNLAGSRRIELVRPFLDSVSPESWINRMKENYGKVENLGFSDQTQRMVGESWKETELGQKTALGDALAANLGNEKENKSSGCSCSFFGWEK